MNFSSNILYSVIIPFRGNILLLKRLIDSIPDRIDIQIIIVDNNEYRISKEHFSNRTNIIVTYSDKMKGAGHARNVGLRIARGKWLLFADADDFYTPDAFDSFDRLKDSSADIVYFSADSCYSDSLKPAKRNLHVLLLICNFSLSNRISEDDLRYKYLVPWGKMIKADLINKYQINFDEVIAYNDVLFSLKTGYYAKSIEVSSACVYCITDSRESIDHRKGREYLASRYQVQLRKSVFLRKIGMNRYQSPFILYYWISAFQYGLKFMLSFVHLARKSNVNIFVGWWNVFTLYDACYYRNKRKAVK